MNSSSNLDFVEEFFFVVSATASPAVEIPPIAIRVDLTEFAFTEQEIQKLNRLCRKLEFALLDEFHRHFAAASVVVEIQSRQ